MVDLGNMLPETLETFIVSVLGLYIVVNPLAVASVFLGLTPHATASQRRQIAWRASITAALILTFFALAGTYILSKLLITSAALQIAGGILLFALAFALVRGKEKEFFGDPAQPEAGASPAGLAYSPLAVPMIAGPASITMVMTSSTKAGDDPYAWAALLGAIAVTALLCVLYMQRWLRIEEKHGPGVSMVAPRIMGLVLAVISVQFIIDGVEAVVRHLLNVTRGG